MRGALRRSLALNLNLNLDPNLDYSLHRLQPEDWPAYRAIRLAMLRDTPLAYLETVDDALALPESEWRFRTTRAAGPGNVGVAAVGPDGAWVGVMNGFLPAPDTAKLVGVWLEPGHRGAGGTGAGLAARMLDEVVRWAREETGAKRLTLLVHEENGRAIGFYRRSGFVLTGRTERYPLDVRQSELEMVLGL
ncbi:acetyltransferase [Streptomyces laurentii]|uniref:Acetyltransferase n=1 Tax=Streptomyces laurentii TaxID=39478 RepID=A0A169NI30_STRLU|nr:acetyltransferase [Streptomyces laurentii]